MAKVVLKTSFLKIITFSILFTIGTSGCLAEEFVQNSAFSPLKLSESNNFSPPQGQVSIDLSRTLRSENDANLNENRDFYSFINATDRFVQSNISASWEDFRTIINSAPENDFIYISYANKMAELGLFDLATLSSSKIKDHSLAGISTDAMKRFYYPRIKLKRDEEWSLAEAYSNILYNNQSSEATNELLKNDALLSTSDYANYLVALGSYKSNYFSRASKYINIAIIQNPANLNYQKLKAEILAESDDEIEAMKVVENLKKQNLYSYEYEKKVKSLEQFVLYKTKKAQWEKDYHLGYYYHIEGDDSKAIRTLQTALSSKKRGKIDLIYGLMSEIYLGMNEFEKASDTAKKAYKINKNNSKALVTLGDLCYQDKDYKKALEYYKNAASQDKKDYIPFVKEAQGYQKLSNVKKAKEIYVKVLKTHSDSWEAYYNVALLDKGKRTIYLKKALAVNPLFEPAWVDLAKDSIDDGNYDMAQKYLSNAFYIDENDFRYYYYQGLVNINSGEYSLAEVNFKKCLKLNSDFKEAKDGLNSIVDIQGKQQIQDSI